MAADTNVLVISPRQPWRLVNPSTRPDFVHFVVEVRSDAKLTNIVTFTTTNHTLNVMNLARVPSGPGIVGVKVVYADGEDSDMTLRRYDLRRGRPPAPDIEPFRDEAAASPKRSLAEELGKRQAMRIQQMYSAPLPPIPAVNTFGITTNVTTRGTRTPLPPPRPLPGTSDAYFDFLDRVADARQRFRNE